LIKNLSEIPTFEGLNIKSDYIRDQITVMIIKAADEYKKDLDFQIMVSKRRKALRLKQKKSLEEENINN
jgi:hypothetical protein